MFLSALVLVPAGCVSRPQTEVQLPSAKLEQLRSTMDESEKKIASSCPYFNFAVVEEQQTVELERFNPGWQLVERDRQIWLDATRQAASALGFTLVQEVEEAGFVLQASGGRTTQAGLLFLNLQLVPTPRLMHHVFVASMNDGDFPFSMTLGSNYTFTFQPQGYATAHISTAAATITELAWSQSRETVLTLCEVSEMLVDEGITMDELREELVKEIQRVRRQRRGRQLKQLDIEIEESAK